MRRSLLSDCGDVVEINLPFVFSSKEYPLTRLRERDRRKLRKAISVRERGKAIFFTKNWQIPPLPPKSFGFLLPLP